MRDVGAPVAVLEALAVAVGAQPAVLDGEQHAVLVAPVAALALQEHVEVRVVDGPKWASARCARCQAPESVHFAGKVSSGGSPR